MRGGEIVMVKIFNRDTERAKRKSLCKEMPPAEVALWQYLRDRQASGHKFRRQYSVDQYILDFYCPPAKLAIELDGDSPFSDAASQSDEVRQKTIENLGIRFLRFTNQDVYENLDGIFEKILKHLPPLPS